VQDSYITLKEYAIKNKISIFQAMKLVKSNSVEYISKEIDGKEVILIKYDNNREMSPKDKDKTSSKGKIDGDNNSSEILNELKEIKSLLQKIATILEEQKEN
jgi:hypothetical protein